MELPVIQESRDTGERLTEVAVKCRSSRWSSLAKGRSGTSWIARWFGHTLLKTVTRLPGTPEKKESIDALSCGEYACVKEEERGRQILSGELAGVEADSDAALVMKLSRLQST